MKGFKKINQNIYYLKPPKATFGGGVTFVTGKSNFLIDCGAYDSSVTEYIVPALKDIGYSLRDVDYLVFTHCHPENMGGAHKLKQVSPSTHIMAYGHQTDRLKNPTYYLGKNCSLFPDAALPFREVNGVLAYGVVQEDSIIFSELRPIPTPGHDKDCVCWYHIETKTLICGDAIQGRGTATTGTAYYTNLKEYRASLNDLDSNLEISTMISSEAFSGVPNIISSAEKCVEALRMSYAVTEEYDLFVSTYVSAKKKKKEPFSLEQMVEDYFCDKEKPTSYAYATITLSQHMK